MEPVEYQPGERVPAAGAYEQLNVFGTWTGRVELMAEGDAFPDSPRGFTWRPLAARSAAELRAQAEAYRRMAATARTETVLASLLRLVDRLEALAAQREAEEQGPGS